MESRFLFRGKRSSDGKWIVGCLCLSEGARGTVSDISHSFEPKESGRVEYIRTSVDPATVGQCTGMSAASSYRCNDPEDLLIFEGDILRIKAAAPGYMDVEYEYVKVFWRDDYGAWMLSRCGLGVDELFVDFVGEIEIVGNIHDHPELLEVSKNEQT